MNINYKKKRAKKKKEKMRKSLIVSQSSSAERFLFEQDSKEIFAPKK